jgi:hypothetical protein
MQKSAAVALLFAVAVLCPHASRAMTVEMYDAMAVEDQSDYVKLLVKRAHDVFVEEGQQDLAAKLDELFHKRRGEPQAVGEAQFEKQLGITRDVIAWEDARGYRIKPLPGDVEASAHHHSSEEWHPDVPWALEGSEPGLDGKNFLAQTTPTAVFSSQFSVVSRFLGRAQLQLSRCACRWLN